MESSDSNHGDIEFDEIIENEILITFSGSNGGRKIY